jgi:hypothetical protein
VEQFLDPALPLNLISPVHDNAHRRAVAKLAELCSVGRLDSSSFVERMMDRSETLANGELYRPVTREYGAVGLIVPLAMAAYFVNGARQTLGPDERPILSDRVVPEFLEAVIDHIAPVDVKLPRHKELSGNTVSNGNDPIMPEPRLGVLKDIWAAHTLRQISISRQSAAP